jgi:Family of unknown function (DUF6252)
MNMKSPKPYYLLFAVIFYLASCTKEVSEEHGTSPVVPGSGNFTATISGTAWSADSLQMALVGNGVVNISGLAKTGEQISMILPSFKTGTYTVNSNSSGYALYVNFNDPQGNVYLSNVGSSSGSVVISKIDTVNKVISGTFSFSVTNSVDMTVKTITNGSFNNIPYTSDNVIPPGGSKDTLVAAVDGVNFASIQILTNDMTGQITIAGFSAAGDQVVSLTMPDTVQTNSTYTLDFNTGLFAAAYSAGTTTFVSGSSSVLTILLNDPVARRIRGTFSFTANSIMDPSAPAVNITKGFFATNY